MAGPPGQAERVERVSTLELFFDLVFVFTITQLTAVLSDDPTLRGLLRVVLMLGVIYYMYGGYAWLTNAVAADRRNGARATGRSNACTGRKATSASVLAKLVTKSVT